MELDEFVLRNVFYRIPEGPTHDEILWREVKGGGEGYIVVYPNGEHNHTYHHPENTFGPSEDE